MSFPSTSIGRSKGTRLASQQETAHPLGSPTSTPSNGTPSSAPLNPSTPPRYVPYTPRQRVVTTSPSVSLAISTGSSPSVQPFNLGGGASATSKLQLQSLKAAVQTMGLDNESLGWVILEKIVAGEVEGAEWDEIWNTIAGGQATLLLPTEKAPSGLIVTPEVVRDHIAFCNVPAKDSSPLVTMGGLRGHIRNNSLVFRSALPTDSKVYRSLLGPTTRAATLSSLAPLPAGSDPATPYPTFSATSYNPSLSFPPRPIPHLPPPLPPRPMPAPVPTSRLHNPFTSFFSKASNPVASPVSPTVPLSSSPTPSFTPLAHSGSPSRPASILSDGGDASDSKTQGYGNEGHIVSIFAIDKKIVRKDIGKAVSKALKAQVKSELSAAGLPSWVSDRILSFTIPLQPLAKSAGPSPKSSGMADSTSASVNQTSVPPPSPSALTSAAAIVDVSSTPQETSNSFQDFYELLEDELRKYWMGTSSPILGRNAPPANKDDSAHADSEQEEKEKRLNNAMDKVEAVLTALFYDQLFNPSSSDDSSHDEALASRIAALNMLDLNWNHLGVEIEEGGAQGVDEVVQSCGKVLELLHHPDNRSPKAKADLLVKVHKVIVDGLSHLPPVHLKPDGEPEPEHAEVLDSKTPRQQSFNNDAPKSPSSPSARSPLHLSVPLPIPTPGSPRSLSPILPGSPSRPPSIIEPLSSPIISPRQELRSLSPAPEDPLTSPSVLAVPLHDSSDQAQSSENDQEKPVPEIPPPLPPKQGKTLVNTDVLLPIIIFSVVKANPVQLVSQLLYVQRYRSKRAGGEEAFCLINFLAVVEFLEHVDMQALGLGEADRVMSTQDLTPLPISPSTDPTSPLSFATSASARLRGRVEQQVGELTHSATKVISGVGGVVDSSFTVLRGFLAPVVPGDTASAASAEGNVRPGFGLLRRGTNFSIASVAASLPGTSSLPKERKVGTGDEGQMLIEVPSRPGSIRDLDAENGSEYAETSDADEETDDEGEDDDDEDDHDGPEYRSDARSIRSFSSMMSRESPEEKKERLTLSERLAAMPALSRLAGVTPPGSRRTSLLPPGRSSTMDAPSSSNHYPAEELRIAPPNARFLECSPDDLRVSEVRTLLEEYRRVVAGLKVMGGFSAD